MFKDIAVVIPVRMGSSRIKNKATLDFGKFGGGGGETLSLLEWKIRQLKQMISKKNIFVSTESDILKEIALKNDVQIHHRDFFLADGHKASFSEVITGIVKDIPYKHIAWVPAVVPLMSPKEYAEAFKKYVENVIEKKKNDSLFSANLLKEYFWNDEKPINYKADQNHTISQELPNIYRVTNGLYMRERDLILKEKYFLGKNPYKFIVSKIAGIDIDEMEDYEIAANLLGIYNAYNQEKI